MPDGDYADGVARLARLGQPAQNNGSPFGPVASAPPQDPRRQRPDSIAPIAIAANAIPNTTSAAANTSDSDGMSMNASIPRRRAGRPAQRTRASAGRAAIRPAYA